MTQAWIANRTDGQYGSGTQADPYDGSGPDNFAEVMQALPPHSEVILLPGEYSTYGWNEDHWKAQSRSFMLKPGQRFHGCGMGTTTLKLVGIEKTPSDYNIMLAAVKGTFDHTTVSDLTIDMNFDGQDYKDAMMSACHLQGSHARIDRVRMINFGNKSTRWENFAIGLGGGQAPTNVVNISIKDCVIERPAWMDEKAAFTAVQFFGGADGGSSTYQGEVSGNYFDGQFPDGTITAHTPLSGHAFEPGRYSMQAIGVGDGWQMVYRNNRIRNLVNGIYMDTGRGKDLVIEGNRFHNVYAAVGFHYQSPDATWDRITVEDNDIALVRVKGLPANAPYGIYMGSHTDDNLARIKEAIITNNRIHLVGMDMDPENRTMAGIAVDHVEQAVIEDNLFRLPRSIMTPNTSGHIYLNKVSRVRAANNLRMELGTIIAPWRADLKQWYR